MFRIDKDKKKITHLKRDEIEEFNAIDCNKKSID